MSSSNKQGVLLVSLIFLLAVGTVLYVNLGSPSPDQKSSSNYRNYQRPQEIPWIIEDPVNYEQKSIIDCENMGPPGPRFLGAIANVTVEKGHNVSIPCVVENLGTFRMAWLRYESQIILSIHDSIITRNPRIGLSTDSKTFETPCKNRTIESMITMYILEIDSVKEDDEGYYMCQLNTDPMKGQWGYLKVNPPGPAQSE